ncbi:MAG: hypothetical protein MN733_42915, partial [Nitrososphaera sp.]|nr:hypothetical protein [Nitrososphaera sp.]
AKYADRALKMMLDTMKNRGAMPDRLVSKMVGGAKMFSSENACDDLFNVGNRNCDSVRALLKSLRIPLIAESVGSTHGKWVTFDLLTGKVAVRSTDSETVL